MAQAIFLPGAWGKIPVFMGKNHPTPRAAMAFLHAQNYPPKICFLANFAKWIKFLLTTCKPIVYIIDRTNEKPAVLFITKRGL